MMERKNLTTKSIVDGHTVYNHKIKLIWVTQSEIYEDGFRET